jgi:hypothetical protein
LVFDTVATPLYQLGISSTQEPSPRAPGATGGSQDIHPAAKLGCGLMLDHATGVIIGETAVVGDNVSLLHHVTLGGTGTTGGDRHPKVRPHPRHSDEKVANREIRVWHGATENGP